MRAGDGCRAPACGGLFYNDEKVMDVLRIFFFT